jgi:hypothetical protein
MDTVFQTGGVLSCDCPAYLKPLAPEDDAERRARAALAATADFSIEGLEQIASGGHSLQLALMASAVVAESGWAHWTNHGNHTFKPSKSCYLCAPAIAEAAAWVQTINDGQEPDDAEAFRGTRGD